MTGDEENIEFGGEHPEDDFKCYKMIVKTLTRDKVRHQNLEIYTSGLKNLLEMRRIHNTVFSVRYEAIFANIRYN